MRRLIIEISENELEKIGVSQSSISKIKSLNLLNLLRQDPQELSGIWRIEFKSNDAKVEELEDTFQTEIQVLQQEKNGAYTIFMRVGPRLSSTLSSVTGGGGYFFQPIEIQDGKIKISFIGSIRQVKSFISSLKDLGIHFKITSLTDQNFSPTSPLNKLTEKQRKILLMAYKQGYYDVPRKITSKQLAKKMGISDATLIEHLRKTQQRLLMTILA